MEREGDRTPARRVEGRREAEEHAEAPRENVQNVPEGPDIQPTVGGQGEDAPKRAPGRREP